MIDPLDSARSETTAVIFSGQGAQHVGMADRWAEHPASAGVFAEASSVLGQDVVELCRDAEALASTESAQRALFVCGVAAWQALEAEGIRPDAVAGHSLGEFTALVAAGVYPFAETLEVVAVRSTAMAAASQEQPGTMTAVLGPDALRLAEAVRHDLANSADSDSGWGSDSDSERGDDGGVLIVANHNSDRQVVLSGTVQAVERAETLVREGGGRTKRLRVAGAFHSSLMSSAARRVESALDAMAPATPGPWVVPNVTGKRTRDPELLASLLRRHLLAPVLWADTVRELADLGVDQVFECGPRPVLTGLTRPALRNATFYSITDPDAVHRLDQNTHPAINANQMETMK